MSPRSHGGEDPFALARRIKTPIWVYDTDHKRISYANQAACELWGAETEDCLRDRDLSKDMSTTVADRLRQYQVDFFIKDSVFNETWTLYPNGEPTTVNLVFSGFEMPGGRMSMMCEVVGQNVQTTETLRSTQALLHTDVNIALFSQEGHILYKNPAAWNVLPNDDSTLEQLFLNSKDYEESKAVWEREGESRCVTKIKTSDGEKWFDLRVKPCLDPDQGENALLITAVDVSELKKTETIMQESKEAAESANVAKSEFLANMSHEIRTPMNGVLGMVDVLSQSDLNSQQKRCIDILSQSGENLLKIISDILDFSKIEAGRITLDVAQCNLKRTLESTIGLFNAAAADKNLSLEFEYNASLPEHYLADSTRIQQIMSNLIGNAIKFTHKGSITVRVDGSVSNGTASLNLTVEDTGIGIAKSKIAVIFDKFSQAENSTTRHYGGTGLGLSISQKLAVLMKGTLGVSSKLGVGTSFTLNVPLSVVKDVAPKGGSKLLPQKLPLKTLSKVSNANKPKTKRSGRVLKLLIVEDNEINRTVLSSFLKNSRITISFAKNGREAIRAFKTDRFDMIFMDVSMPVMGGVEATQKIREYETETDRERTTIICLSAHVAADDRRKFLHAGMDDYLSKPLVRKDLYAILSKWLTPSKSKRKPSTDVKIALAS